MSNFCEPLADDYSIICDHYAEFPLEDKKFVKSDAPALIKTRDGALLCAVPLHFRGAPRPEVPSLQFYLSEDQGETWPKLPCGSHFCAGTLFRHDESLYYLGTGPGEKRDNCEGLRIIHSTDEGRTWSAPVNLFKGLFYQPAGGYVIRGNHFYWCVVENFNDPERITTTYGLAGDLRRDLTDPGAWRISNGVANPGVPPSLTAGEGKMNWLEGNVVEINGTLQVSWRCQIDRRSTAGIGAICHLTDDGKQLHYAFRQFYPLPGAQNHFHILHDAVSGLYWMTTNLPTRSQDAALSEKLKNDPRYATDQPGMERRILALYCSLDALNWLPARYVMVWPLMRQASNYCGLLIDGDDLLVAARTSRDGRNQHDNDLTTFHRIRNFRQSASPLLPQDEPNPTQQVPKIVLHGEG